MPFDPSLRESGHWDEAAAKLLSSISAEEEALATLMNAEAQKILAFIHQDPALSNAPSSQEYIQFNYAITRMMDTILMTKWMLMKKMDSILFFQSSEKELKESGRAIPDPKRMPEYWDELARDEGMDY
ncbi:hypothetical protein E6C60_0580 [Paenibacillus algicola]|uniref:Uncharacterized protein n=1 Tax=Paenibacillus algicola TaxID=2565926 RepID=A0A4P8XGP6_9BACL|nr:hypothetical protein [Paenibacillus algicola]QCT01303.1 hypothetical protein E6C60_0580 [Paenibacillus algicola]